jgi:polar amino acid transport system substrate-binding protein
MKRNNVIWIVLVVLAALVVLILVLRKPAASPAGSAGTATATQLPAATQPPTATQPPAATEVPSATPVPPPTSVAQVPPASLAQAGHLLICTDFPYPPQEFFDANGDPQGLDIDIGNEIANRLGLKVQYVNSVFDTIIAAVSGGKCDIILSAQNITTDRSKQISQIPYFEAGQSMVATKGNPDNINTTMDLCGLSAAAESGTTEADYLAGTGDYAGKGLTQACTAAGKKPITVVVTQKDTDALQQLQAGKVAVYFADSPVAAYYTVQNPDQFQVVGQVLEPIAEGIGIPCGAADCTNAPLSPVGQAVKAALESMKADGTYLKILTKYNLESSAVK